MVVWNIIFFIEFLINVVEGFFFTNLKSFKSVIINPFKIGLLLPIILFSYLFFHLSTSLLEGTNAQSSFDFALILFTLLSFVSNYYGLFKSASRVSDTQLSLSTKIFCLL